MQMTTTEILIVVVEVPADSVALPENEDAVPYFASTGVVTPSSLAFINQHIRPFVGRGLKFLYSTSQECV